MFEFALLGSLHVATYGQNFKRLRGRVSQEEIARRLKLKRQANVSAIELSDKIPTVKIILRHAVALGHLPSELLKDVRTEHERVKAGEYDGLKVLPLKEDRRRRRRAG
jgi:transcriptional regulator with XRE-family HTH domain